ncbi:hypothetical protein WN51_13570 [Melipona quadrifasciata]|uniref:Kinesin-like protein n=1 Tax=Melipona quadrifasciata TaxID=166423 RepID=A0A0M9A218_9HYME|nr:hypothetical protein WN51_13570 [Melipona quadrifasciata]
MNDTRNMKREKKQHIQVFVRVRPINNIEKIGKSMTVVDIPSNKEVIVRERPHDKFTKKFTFDKVFGPNSKQIQVYNAVVSPLLEEVLAGYNCTVFAYGQTGVQEYSVRVSFLELYNEEIFDLLSPSDDAAKIRIYEDPIKKGAVIVHGLEEISIHTKNEVFNILQKGSDKRQTATTLMNAHSSRSHTIFSITIHIRENTIDGEELLKTGKLNLVDLAGSENVGRSGAVDKRAREAGSINQSLLTLGRVITALAEKTPHVPYRESKLTRLLQESLGGRTRTSIIATVSPASLNLEETLSTLDYAHRAKNITNRPEINQKFSKKALLQEYIEEIERLKKDLIACRERNGIYLTPDSYNEMQSLIEFQSKEIEEKLNHIKALEECMNSKEQIFNELKSKHFEQANELLSMKNQLQNTVNVLMSTSTRLVTSEQEKEEQKHLVEKHAYTENILLSQVQSVLDVADTATSDVNKLHEKIFRKLQIGQRNKSLAQQFKNYIKEQIRRIENDVTSHIENLIQFCTSMKNHIDAQNISFNEDIEKSIQVMSQDLLNLKQNIHELKKNTNDSYLSYQQWLETENKNVTTMTNVKISMLNNISSHIVQKFDQLIENKLAESLQELNSDISQNIDNLVQSTEESIISISKCLIEKRDCLNNNMLEIKEYVKNIRRDQNDIIEKRTNFLKMMDDLQHCFNEVQKEEEENHFTVCTLLNTIDETCEVINNQASDTYKINIEKQHDLQERFRNDLDTIKKEVVEITDQSRLLHESAVAQAKISINDFQADLNKNCDTLMNFKNCVERNITEMQQKMEKDKSLILSAINDVYVKVYTTSNKHINCLKDYKIAFMNIFPEISQKLESENINTANMNSKIVLEIQEIIDQIDKFFAQDLYRDSPTGSTPAKKDFQYPKKLVKTSPHERLLKRYRETLKDIEDTENEVSLDV